jgi:uridine kinase
MRPHLLALGGPSCAGKGEISAFLSARLAAPILDLDSYYKEQSDLSFEQRCLVNYDVPEALDTALLFEQAAALAEGLDIYKPVYDFSRHTRDTRTEHFQPASYVIIEGLFTLFWPELRALCHTRLFIDAPDEVCLRRRIDRDTHTRGRTETEVRQRFLSHVQPASIRYIRPTRPFADLVLDGVQPIPENGQRVLDFLDPGGQLSLFP